MPAIRKPPWPARLGFRSPARAIYGGVPIEDATMGNGRRDANAADIRRALALYRYADAILIALLGAMAAILIGSR